MSSAEPRVVVQLANGEEMPAQQRTAYSQPVTDELSFSSPPVPGTGGQVILTSAAGTSSLDEEMTVRVEDTSGGSRRSVGSIKVTPGGLERIHPPSSPSPPPSMTPPDHHHSGAGHVVHHHHGGLIRTSTVRSGNKGIPAVIVATPDGQSPGQAAIQSDHCYGLPYQDHNYGGPVSVGAPMVTAIRSGYGGMRLTKPGPRQNNLSDGDEGPFPIIGGLASYVAEQDSMADPTANPTIQSSTSFGSRTSGIMQTRQSTVSDGVTVTGHQYRSSTREPSGGVSYYQRYNPPPPYTHHYTTTTHAPPYSQSLVTIGGRTYIRQMAAPSTTTASTTSSGGNYRPRREYAPVMSTPQHQQPVYISPYATGRRLTPTTPSGGTQVLTHTHKRAGRPRTARAPTTTVSRHTTLIPTNTSTSGAPLLTAAGRGRPPSRGRGGGTIGSRRRATSTTHTASSAHVVGPSPSTLITGSSPRKSEPEMSTGKSFLANANKHYEDLLKRPLPDKHNMGRPVLQARSPRSKPIVPPLSDKDTVVARVMAGPDPMPGSPLIVTASQPILPPERTVGNFVAPVPPPVPRIRSPSLPSKSPGRSPHQLTPIKIGTLDEGNRENEMDEKNVSAQDSDTSDSEEPSSSESDSESSSDDEFVDYEGNDDYKTRCLCSLQHNDEYMIQCEKCDVWQHCRCMGLPSDPKRLPENYMCEECKPRKLKLNPVEARQLQEKKLAKWEKEKERKRLQKLKKQEQKAKDKLKRKEERKRALRKAAEKIATARKSDTFSDVRENEYTADAKKFVEAQGDSSGQDLLSQVNETLCQSMFVAAGKQGLVAAHLVPPNQPVSEFRGRVCLKSECNGRDKMGRQMAHVLLYSGFTGVTGADLGASTLCVDARNKGSAARFVRRSCRPNTQVKHVIKDGKLHLLLISTELIERGTEVTAPFDFDFRSSKYPFDCACGATVTRPEAENSGSGTELDPCPIAEFNRELSKNVAKKSEMIKERHLVKKRQMEAKKRVAAAKRKQTKIENEPLATVKSHKVKVNKVKIKDIKKVAKKVKMKLPVKQKSKLKLKFGAKKKSANKKPSPAARSRTVSSSKSSEPIKKETRSKSTESETKTPKKTPQMLTQLKDYWHEEDIKPLSIDHLLPEDRNRPLSREERKLQMQIAQIEKKDLELKKKEERVRVKSESSPEVAPKKTVRIAATRGRKAKDAKTKKGGKSPKVDKKAKKGKVKKKTEKKTRKTSKRRTRSASSDHGTDESESEVSSDEDDNPPGASPGTSRGGASGSGGPSDGGTGGSSGGGVRRHQPPRKRWASSHGNANKSNESVAVVASSSPASGKSSPASGKKRWLRQAMSEESTGEVISNTQDVTPPPKKRKVEKEIKEEETPNLESSIQLTTAEAAELLTQMGQADVADVTPASPGPQMKQEESPEIKDEPKIIPTEPVDEVPQPDVQIFPVMDRSTPEEISPPIEEQSRPAAKRKKVSLDEYKKRKGGSTQESSTSTPSTATPQPLGQAPSFMPQMTESQLLESGRSHRLSSLPDPSQIGKGTATLDDLKEKIYGKKCIPQTGSDVPPPPPPPPPPKPKTQPPQELPRMSLEDRLRTEFGLEEPTEIVAQPPVPPTAAALYGPTVMGPPGTYTGPPVLPYGAPGQPTSGQYWKEENDIVAPMFDNQIRQNGRSSLNECEEIEEGEIEESVLDRRHEITGGYDVVKRESRRYDESRRYHGGRRKPHYTNQRW